MIVMKIQKRKGYLLSFEILLIFPIITMVFLGMVQFSALLAAEAKLAHACREACRVAALGGCNQHVEESVEQVLGKEHCRHVKICTHPEKIETCLSGQPVIVFLEVPAHHMAPNLLCMIGFDLKKQKLINRVVMRKE